MKILIATDSYLQINGVTNSVKMLAQGLKERGHEVKLLALSADHQSYRDGDIYYIKSANALVYPEARISVAVWDPLIDELVAWKPDIAHIQTEFSAKWLTMRVVHKCGIPYVMTLHTNYEEFIKSKNVNAALARTIIKNFERISFDKANTLIVPSEKIRELVEIYKVKCPVTVIPTGIELKEHPETAEDKAELLKELGIRDNGKVLVSVSRVSKEKNVDELIDYMPALLKAEPEASLLMVGGGPYLEKLREKVENLGLSDHVKFTDMVPKDDVWKYYRLGNVFVSASTFETQGLTYAEALASSLPLVCREDKCLIHIIEQGKNGFTYTDEEEYVKHITEILSDRELQRSMGEVSLSISPAFGKDVFIDAILKLYGELIEKAKNPEKTEER